MKKELKSKTFDKCTVCGDVYENIWGYEKSEKEMLEIWGNIPQKDRIVICDNCWKKRTEEEIKAMGEEYKAKVQKIDFKE